MRFGAWTKRWDSARSAPLGGVARKRARRSGLVQFFAVYQFDRGGILKMCHTVGELCNHAVRGSMVWRQTSDTICEFTVNSVF